MRNDIHSPKNFEPGDYAYLGSIDNFPEPGSFAGTGYSEFETDFGPATGLNPRNAEYRAAHNMYASKGVKIHFGDASQCDHCGAHIRYVAFFRHMSGAVIATGETCATERFGCDSRREYDIKRLREEAKNQRERDKAFARCAEFVRDNCPELEEWLLTPAAKTIEGANGAFADIAGKLIRYGSISPNQIGFLRKLLAEHYERLRNNGRTDRQVAIDAERAAAADCPKGRVVITGVVVKTAWYENDFGGSAKMTIKDDSGFLVWVTVPSEASITKGDRVSVKATVTPSDRDPKFGFGKRPTNLSIETPAAGVAAAA